MGGNKKVLVIGGSFAGLCVARDLKSEFMVTIVDAKEFFEYTPGILRAYVKPAHFDALSFTLQPVVEDRMGCKLIWGEVKELDGAERTAKIKTIYGAECETICFDYCLICAGCNFGPFHKWGESLWFPTIHEEARPQGSWPHPKKPACFGCGSLNVSSLYGKSRSLASNHRNCWISISLSMAR